MKLLLPFLALGALLWGAIQDPLGPGAVVVGEGEHRYLWVPGWAELPEGMTLGNTHGCMAVDGAGRIYANTDSEHAVVVFEADGSFVTSWGAELAGGLHGMVWRKEGEKEFLYLAHTGRHQVLKTTLDGEVVQSFPWPEESGHYESATQYRPTGVAVAPSGDVYVVDGYGKGWLHRFRSDGSYVASWGGPGEEPGRFRTPHGIWLDARGAEPALIVADRENHRLQVFDLEGELLRVIDGDLRRPCTVFEHGGHLAVADLAGRVTILDENDEFLVHLGDNPDPDKRANNGVRPESWADGEFLAPHGVAWDARGDLYVLDWNFQGRLSKLARRK